MTKPNVINTISSIYKKTEKYLASLKFAVIIITAFTLALVYGTFMESYHGRDFASRIVYKSWWFMAIQGLMFLSILLATLVRLPPKKRLYGFYTIHAGLIILFIGSFVTYTSGVDGMIELLPGKPTNTVVIDEDHFEILRTKDNRLFDVKLPYLPFETNINGKLKDLNLELVTYLPSSRYETKWIHNEADQAPGQSGVYQIFNPNVSETIQLSLHPNSDFQSMRKMGPLSVHMMPQALHDCFLLKGDSGYIIWNVENNRCFTPEQESISVEKTSKGTTFFVYPHIGGYLKFFPDFSPFPLNDDLTKDESSPFRVMSKKLFEDKPHLFVFGDKIIYHTKRKGWVSKDLNAGIAMLPWMGFQFRLMKYSEDSYPIKVPVYQRPVQDGGNIVEGQMSAVQVKIAGQTYWVTTEAPLALSNGSDQLRMQIKKKTLKLPYQVTLDRFKMDTNPGTNTPASFESFVSVLDGRSTEGAFSNHVFMNNPLKYDGFTFYQSSYFPIGPDQYGSALSVNFDPGRWIKYLGSFLIVFGSIWHYLILADARKRRKVKASQGQVNVIGEYNV